MAPATAADLHDILKQLGLAPKLGWQSLVADRDRGVMELVKELVTEQTLTAYQAEHILSGQERSLVVGSYVLMERIGTGGMGDVFKARHIHLDRLDALKVIRADRLGGAESIQRFQREARACARLRHPNLILIYDAGAAGDRQFLAMELLQGTDLRNLVVQQGPLPVGQAAEYTRQAALGLQQAMERGLVHRDVKPSNFFLTLPEQVVKLLDLGLARLDEIGGVSTPSTALTEDAKFMGTPDFIAPEQALDAHAADVRSDIYSLGCTLYFLLTGQPPFPGGSLTRKLMQHQQEEPRPLESTRSDAPRALGAVLRRMMAKDPGRRFQSPREVADALQPFADTSIAAPVVADPGTLPRDDATGTFQSTPPDSTRATRTARPHRRVPAPWMWTALGAAALLAAVAAWLAYTRHREQDPQSQQVNAPDATRYKQATDGATPAVKPNGAPSPEARSALPRIRYFYGDNQRFGIVVADAGVETIKRLTYDQRGQTNQLVVTIDDRPQLLTEATGKWLERGTSPKSGALESRSKSVWEAIGGKLRIIQTLAVVPSAMGEPNSAVAPDTCFIGYLLENTDDVPHEVGLYLSLDTLIGANDGVPFCVPGMPQLVKTQADFRAPEPIPDFIQALEIPASQNPGTIAQATFALNGDWEAPSRISLTHWPGVAVALPELPLKNMGIDSAMVVYWRDKKLAPNQKRPLGFAYGLGTSATNERWDVGKLRLTMPAFLTKGKSFPILVTILDAQPGQVLTLNLPNGLERVDCPAQQLVPPSQQSDKQSLVTWTVRANRTGTMPIQVQSSTGILVQQSMSIAPPEAYSWHDPKEFFRE